MKRVIKLQLIGAVAIATLLTACDVKDPIYNTSHPESGTITLTTDWSGIGEGLTAPESYKVCIGDYTTTVSGTTNTLDHRFAPGTYRMLIHSTPENIRFDGTVADVTSGNMYDPSGLFSYSAEVTISKDTDHAFTAVMQQQVRQLTLVVEPTGDAADRIESIRGDLAPIASKLDIVNGSYSAPVLIYTDFTKITEGADAGKWTTTMRLLGFMPEESIMLELNIRYRDGNPGMQTITSDLTEALAGFNDNKRTPLTLGGSVVETPTGAEFGATITDWKTVDGGDVSAD